MTGAEQVVLAKCCFLVRVCNKFVQSIDRSELNRAKCPVWSCPVHQEERNDVEYLVSLQVPHVEVKAFDVCRVVYHGKATGRFIIQIDRGTTIRDYLKPAMTNQTSESLMLESRRTGLETWSLLPRAETGAPTTTLPSVVHIPSL